MKAPKIQRILGGSTNLGRVFFAAFLIVGLTGGCHKKQQLSPTAQGEGIEPTDPQVAENLDKLSTELRHAMPGHKLSGNFEEFVAATHLDVPPPPPGEKYAISKSWKVILVEDKTK